jgi:hypothetical protein
MSPHSESSGVMLRTSVKITLATQMMIENETAKPLAAASNAFECLHVLCQKRLSNTRRA